MARGWTRAHPITLSERCFPRTRLPDRPRRRHDISTELIFGRCDITSTERQRLQLAERYHSPTYSAACACCASADHFHCAQAALESLGAQQLNGEIGRGEHRNQSQKVPFGRRAALEVFHARENVVSRRREQRERDAEGH